MFPTWSSSTSTCPISAASRCAPGCGPTLATASIPILHLTATFASSDHWAAALDRGADAYLSEPVEPVVLVATVRALLRTRAAEAEVRQAAERWQTTFDTIPHGLAYLDADGTILRCNRAMADLHDLRPDELVGASGMPPVPGLQPPKDGWPFDRARVTHRREVSEIPWRDRWLEVAVDPIMRDGAFLGAVRTVTDVTERKHAETQREGAVERLDSFLAGITDAYLAFDAEWRVLAVNRVAAETIFRRPATELVGRSARELYPEFMSSFFARQYQRARDEGRPVHFEAESPVLQRWYEVHAYPQGAAWRSTCGTSATARRRRPSATSSSSVSGRRGWRRRRPTG